MKISQVAFEKLFGFYDYSISVNNDVTIIHGPNGCGKTTMLRIIDAVFNKRMDVIKTIDFKSVLFRFSDDLSLKIERKTTPLMIEENEIFSLSSLSYTITEKGQETLFDSSEVPEELLVRFKRLLNGYRPLPFLEKTANNEWYDRRNDEILTTSEVISKYAEVIFRRHDRDQMDDDIPDEVQKILDAIDVHLITADRLTVQRRMERQYGEDRIKVDRQVNIIAEKVAEKIRNAIQDYAQISQGKDRTFPLRAIKQKATMTVEEIKRKMVDLETKRKEFVDTGILEEDKNSIDIHELVEAITEGNRQNLSLYATDTEEKLNSLAGISSLINIFRRLIDNSFQNKRIVFNKDYGFRFKTTYSDTIISPQDLSSGEQHELVMFYDLIFNTSENTLILIDEPELSLHIKWQLSYIDDLLSIIRNNGFTAILATHSPQIIHDKWNLTVSLSE